MSDWKYVGDGDWLPGYPARDISGDEIKERGLDESVLGESKLYKKARRVSEQEGDTDA